MPHSRTLKTLGYPGQHLLGPQGTQAWLAYLQGPCFCGSYCQVLPPWGPEMCSQGPWAPVLQSEPVHPGLLGKGVLEGIVSLPPGASPSARALTLHSRGPRVPSPACRCRARVLPETEERTLPGQPQAASVPDSSQGGRARGWAPPGPEQKGDQWARRGPG